MRTLLALLLSIGLVGCGDFVDEDGNTSFRQVAQGLQGLGDRFAEMGAALERDADVEAVPWRELMGAIPDEVDGISRLELDGEDARDRNGAGISVAHGRYALEGDTLFVGVADLGALRSGAELALRWAAPLFAEGHSDGDLEDVRVRGNPGVLLRDDHGDGAFIAVMAEGRFIVFAGTEDRARESLVREALGEVDYGQLEDWVDYGR